MFVALLMLLTLVTPAPMDTRFTDKGRTLTVMGAVHEPPDPEIPRKVTVEIGPGNVREYGWISKRSFSELGWKVLLVCVDQDGVAWVYVPTAAWTRPRK